MEALSEETETLKSEILTHRTTTTTTTEEEIELMNNTIVPQHITTHNNMYSMTIPSSLHKGAKKNQRKAEMVDIGQCPFFSFVNFLTWNSYYFLFCTEKLSDKLEPAADFSLNNNK